MESDTLTQVSIFLLITAVALSVQTSSSDRTSMGIQQEQLTQEERYEQRVNQLFKSTQGCHKLDSFTEHFEEPDLAEQIIKDKASNGQIKTDQKGLAWSSRTVYCGKNN